MIKMIRIYWMNIASESGQIERHNELQEMYHLVTLHKEEGPKKSA